MADDPVFGNIPDSLMTFEAEAMPIDDYHEIAILRISWVIYGTVALDLRPLY